MGHQAPSPHLPILFVTCLALLFIVPSAAAHADLVSADPPKNSRIDLAPGVLVLRFSEPFDTSRSSRGEPFSYVHVTDDDGTRYDTDNHFERGDTEIHVPLAAMPDGVYLVRWQTLGKDTHLLDGRYLLAVNVSFDQAAIPPETPASQSGAPAEGFATEVAVRTVGFFAGSLAAGISLFVLVLPRGDPLDAARRIHHRATALAGVVAAGAAVALLWVIAMRLGGTVLDAAGTGSGIWIVLRGAAFLLAGAVAWATTHWGPQRRRDDALAAVFGVVGLLATTMSSHAAAESSLLGLAIGADLVHLIAVAFWLGGLLLLGLLVVGRVPAPTLYGAVRRFSPFAILAVAVIVVTGLIATGLRILGPEDLTTTLYGRALLLKIILLVPLVALGAFNRYFVQPRLALADAVRAGRHLRLSVVGEVAIMVVTLVAAATLATVAPPDALGARDEDSGGGFEDLRGIVAEFEAAGIAFTVRALPEPLRVGPQNFTVSAEPLIDDPPEVRDIALIVRPPQQGPQGEGEVHLFQRIDATTWRLSGFILAEVGTWHNDLLVQGRGIYHEEHVPMFVV